VLVEPVGVHQPRGVVVRLGGDRGLERFVAWMLQVVFVLHVP